MDKTGTDSIMPNRKYKDSFFTALFGTKENLLELYKVLHPEDKDVTVNDIEKTVLENVLLVRRYNDAAMKVRDRLLVLSEHQSTPNPNMPLRLLLYIAEEYEKIIKKNNNMQALYSKKQLKLPAPEFYVIYTGSGSCSNYMDLTDSFPEEYKNSPFLQLSVKVITNEDRNNILGGYIAFVKKAEKLRRTPGHTLASALKETVQWCQEEGILARFMEERSEEVMSLMLEEWNMEDALKYSKEEGIEEGMVYAYYEMNLDTNEIARKMQLSEAEVLEIIRKKNIR